MSEEAWEGYVKAHFPGYLLPASAATSISREAASRFLERVTGRPNQLRLLRAAAVVAPRVTELEHFVLRDLADLVRALPSWSMVETVESEGGFTGRLAVVPTLKRHLAGHRTRYVTTSRRRSFDLPENVLLRSVVQQLHGLLVELRTAGVVSSAGWGASCQEIEGCLKRILTATVLREVPARTPSNYDRQAAAAARHRAYNSALQLDRTLDDGLLCDDPDVIARVLAEGALSPMDADKRFELAVLIRLIHALVEHLDIHQPGRWHLERSLIESGRQEVASLKRDDGATIDVFYNQAVLGPGAADLGAKHYFSHQGRLRPDITIVLSRGAQRRAAIIEVKRSESQSYLVGGFHEAMLYRWEYAPALTGWPKAILVGSCSIPGALRSDDVVAIGWSNWVPAQVIESLVSFPP